jgi:membrane-associated phospholipid phosphatase
VGLRPFLLAVCCLAAPSLAAAEEPRPPVVIDSLSDLPRLFLNDGGQVLDSRSHWDAREWNTAWGGLAVILGTALVLDQPVDKAIRTSPRQVSWGRIAGDVAPLGSTPGVLLAVATYVAGAAFHDPEVRATGADAMAAIAIAELALAVPLKVLVGRSRPYSDEGTHSFHPFTGGVSFPSGHTTVAFALASVLSEHAGRPWVSGIAYGMASLVGLARVEQRSHFLSDVVAGGLFGTFVGKVVVAHNRELRAGGPAKLVVTVAPAVLAGGYGLSLTARF